MVNAVGECKSPPTAPHFFFQAEDGIRDYKAAAVQTCALPISIPGSGRRHTGYPRGQLGGGQSAARADAFHERRLLHRQQHETGWRHVSYPWLPVNIAYVPPSEAIETVNISTNSFDAEQGAAGGAAINVAIKSGTNQYHGVAFERNQNNEMTAVNYFSHTSPINKNIFNQYGFAFGRSE